MNHHVSSIIMHFTAAKIKYNRLLVISPKQQVQVMIITGSKGCVCEAPP